MVSQRVGRKVPTHYCEALTYKNVAIGQSVVSDRNLACAVFIRHETLSDGKVQACLFPQQLYILSNCRSTVPVSASGHLHEVWVSSNVRPSIKVVYESL